MWHPKGKYKLLILLLSHEALEFSQAADLERSGGRSAQTFYLSKTSDGTVLKYCYKYKSYIQNLAFVSISITILTCYSTDSAEWPILE